MGSHSYRRDEILSCHSITRTYFTVCDMRLDNTRIRSLLLACYHGGNANGEIPKLTRHFTRSHDYSHILNLESTNKHSTRLVLLRSGAQTERYLSYSLHLFSAHALFDTPLWFVLIQNLFKLRNPTIS